jgi:2'-5' RNA ligase
MASVGREGPFLRLLPPIEATTEAAQRPAAERLRSARLFEFSSLQINLPPAIDHAILAFAANIPDADLADGGRAEQPHLTVQQRLLIEHPRDVVALVSGRHMFSVTFGQTHVFATPDYDVVYVDVSSPRLWALHDAVSTLLHRDVHATFHPHVTIAFVKPGFGARYAGADFLTGLVMSVRALTYSGADGKVVDIPLDWNEHDSGPDLRA